MAIEKSIENVHGKFVMQKGNIPVKFVCDRCHVEKTTKTSVQWTTPDGSHKTVCNGCYGWLVADARKK